MKAVRLLAASQSELDSALGWYRNEMPHRLTKFADAVGSALESIGLDPESCSPVELPAGAPEVRRAPVRGFPWGVYFLVTDDEVVVLAVAHTHQEPEYWLERIPGAQG